MNPLAPHEQPRGWWTLYAPIIVVQVYLWFTVALFAWGPWDWRIDNPTALYGYLTLAHIALLLGYARGIRREGLGYRGQFSAKSLLNPPSTAATSLRSRRAHPWRARWV